MLVSLNERIRFIQLHQLLHGRAACHGPAFFQVHPRFL